MVKAPSKRRGITLGPGVGSAASNEELSAQMAAPAPSTPGAPFAAEPTHKGPGPHVEALQEIESLRRQAAELESRWQHQAEQLQAQRRQLEEQQEQIALQARQHQVLVQTRRTAGRLGVLLSILILAGVGALGFHTWPGLQELASDVSRASLGVGQLAPQMQAVRGEVSALTSDLGQMGSTMDSLRQDVSQVRSDLGSLRQAVDTWPEGKGPVQADTGGRRGVAQTSPRAATTAGNPYRGMRPRMPW